MKPYAAYMEEIAEDELYKGLLAHGLFAEKLPPVFTSIAFYDYCEAGASFSDVAYDYVSFDSIRNINTPRTLSIPVPMSYQRLCAGIRDNWPLIKQVFHNNTDGELYKISRIHIRKMKNRDSLFEMSYDDWRSDGTPEDNLIIGNRYVVFSDISTCFPSIYSHALCWALTDKETAKSTRNIKGLWYNQIDHLCQNIRNGETHGLMIGPHVSNLLSEVILTTVDHALRTRGWKFVRNIDDYTCFVQSEEDGQKFVRELAEQLRHFDLPLNYKKTKVAQLPGALSEGWVRQLNAYSLIAPFGKVGYKEARSYMDLAIELMQKSENNSAVLNYAIKVLAKQKLTDNAKTYCIKEAMHLAYVYPYLLPILDEYVFVPYDAETSVIEQFANQVFKESERVGNYEGMIYGIYFALKYDFDLTVLEVDNIIASDSCLLKLFGFLYAKRINWSEDIKKYRDEAKRLKELDMDRNWLFVYETLTHGNLKGEWRRMKEAGVSFLIKEFQPQNP